MNYLRGAVSAISAPYQYYKDLPPINPSTLTGAIDVIVVKRPAPDGGEELACSPFHVRFGKWQVLRPAEKKVNVSVNGRQIPYYMKIGDAGEAFFVFETESDVPDDLITSPLLEATKPGETNAAAVKAGRFGAKEREGEESSADEESGKREMQEPEPLDLDAQPSSQELSSEGLDAPSDSPAELKSPASPSSLLAFPKAVVKAVVETERDNRQKVKDRALAAHNAVKDGGIRRLSGELCATGDKGDEVLPQIRERDIEPVNVVYTNDMVIDASGYGSHSKDRSDSTVTGSSSKDTTRAPSPESLQDRDANDESSQAVPFPTMRVTSEPPPEHESDYVSSSRHPLQPIQTASTAGPSSSKLAVPTEEYSWEWGAFPQKSPVKPNFSRTVFPVADHVRSASKGKAQEFFSEVDEGFSELESVSKASLDMNRSVSVPPDVGGNLPITRKGLEEQKQSREDTAFGSGARLRPSSRDPYLFQVDIFGGQQIDFELSLVDDDDSGVWQGEELEAARRFDGGRVTFDAFLEDESIVRDDRLVIRWAGDKYITRQDGSPLMDALVLWRESALQDKSGSTTPTNDRRRPLPVLEERGVAMLEETPQQRTSSWISWWNRTRTTSGIKQEIGGKGGRPNLREINSVPVHTETVKKPKRDRSLEPELLSAESDAHSISVPTSPPLGSDILDSGPPEKRTDEGTQTSSKRYAKTLRLSSDQLKELDLKPGSNTITFSLSATGVAACTAKIFVWDYTDLVVISDIDGTITKSDALGHVFTMIGRDWTHMGVAKLYTDICRNGYKIMYLTSRAIGQADTTRYYLKSIKQNDYQLPEGPVIMSPDRLFTSLHREVIMRKPEVFKMACLRDIQRLFGGRNPFYAGFGNRITDALSYRSVNVPSSKIFTIDSNGEVKMELLELAGYKSSYIHMTDLVDQMFPPIHKSWAPEFTDFNYWKAPMQEFPLPDLTPPSPALSARSDTSNQSTLARLRNFSLVGSRQNNMKNFTLPPPTTDASKQDAAPERSATLRQMSSFERLTSALGGFTRSSSPGPESRSQSPVSQSSTYLDSGSEDEDDDLEKQRVRRRRERTRSMESMPGSLPGSVDEDIHFGSDDEEHDEDHGSNRGDNGDEANEATFDEDLLATGEMESVPFL
ncbi:LNS2-domain-containing protein [Gloeophyllum trabeum ATCC 11539]|uniref:phosphatidate phosphatase n=1 Tax=Gloeophyllum trabeum (strain ATCC 11539 / FP-39264 / Madison 617) TaxID=670483 RepID=S7QIN0_GLOTA|nr:LNS2-domain-containing protein [Gloeophyllum trabeum ATCC 11539]EPQ59162.1 LNS2-domain-containing protein [Gloeophyllum trabeum ATCC 11539]